MLLVPDLLTPFSHDPFAHTPPPPARPSLTPSWLMTHTQVIDGRGPTSQRLCVRYSSRWGQSRPKCGRLRFIMDDGPTFVLCDFLDGGSGVGQRGLSISRHQSCRETNKKHLKDASAGIFESASICRCTHACTRVQKRVHVNAQTHSWSSEFKSTKQDGKAGKQSWPFESILEAALNHWSNLTKWT